MENHHLICIAKGHIKEAHITLQLCVGNGAVRLVRMLPGPHSCALLTLCNCSVCVFSGVYQGYISLIHLRLLVHHAEDPLCSGKRHDNGVKLLGDGHERLCKALCKLQIGCHDTQSNSSDSHDREETSQDGCQNKLQISDVSDYRSHHIGISICIGSPVEQLFIQLVKLLLCDALVVAHLDHPLTVHVLLHKAGYVGDGKLLPEEIFSAVSSDGSCHKQHNSDHDNGKDS